MSSRVSPFRAIAAASVGNALEFYDFITYAFFAIQIGRAFFPTSTAYGSLMLSLATFGAGFVTRPIGGIVIGSISDRVGRRTGMMLSFMLMGGAAVAMAVVPSYARIGVAAPVLVVIIRLVMGFSVGGEVGPTTAYLLECAPVEKRGLMVAWQGASQMIAAVVGGLAGLILALVLKPAALDAYGWRIAFLLGAFTLPFGLWARRNLPETLHETETHASAVSRATSRGAASRESWRILSLGLVIMAFGTTSTYVRQYMTTFAQGTLHMAKAPAFAVAVVGNSAVLFGCLFGGWLSDRIGRRPVMVWPNLIGFLLTYPVFEWIVTARSPLALLAGTGVLGLAAGMAFGSFYAALIESLPKQIRGGAFGTLYAVSVALFGGTCQLILTWLIHVTGSPMAPAWYLLVMNVFAVVAMWMIPESAPQSLRLRAQAIVPAVAGA